MKKIMNLAALAAALLAAAPVSAQQALSADIKEQIRDVQVAGIPSRKYGEEVGAFIILHEGKTLTEEEVKDFCRGKISRYKIPKYVFFVEEFPLTASGKIQKYKLKDVGLALLAAKGVDVV